MSIYGGFVTRQQEQFYNRLTHKAIELLSERVISYVKLGTLIYIYIYI